MKLSVVLATHNEAENIARCLESVKNIASEIIIVDGESSDNTVEISKKFGAKVLVRKNPIMFHINKQEAIDEAAGDWVLQLDADEFVTKELADEIKKVIKMSDEERVKYQRETPNLLLKHQEVVEKKEGTIGTKEGPFVAFFVPRANYFLGRFLRYGGVYPDGVIRLFKKGKARLPLKDVHEQYVVEGRVGWLRNDLMHWDSPTFNKYLQRNNRYTSFMAKQFRDMNVGRNPIAFFEYSLIKPIYWFVLTFFRHSGFRDLWQGFLFSFFSSLRFPISYFKYLKE